MSDVDSDTKPRKKHDSEKKKKKSSSKSKASKSSKKSSKKSGKPKKDKNAPKRGKSAYIIFCNDERANVKSTSPELGFGEIAKALSEKWKKVDAATKKHYEELAAKDKERYIKEKGAYEKKKKSKHSHSGSEEEEEDDAEDEE